MAVGGCWLKCRRFIAFVWIDRLGDQSRERRMLVRRTRIAPRRKGDVWSCGSDIVVGRHKLSRR